MIRLLHAVVAGVFLAAPLSVQAGERAAADVACDPTDQTLVYDCLVMLKGRKSGAPLEAATVVIKVDMPSMPMAHNVPPVTAMPMAKPGHYHAKIQLDMLGEWALTLDVSGPTRDKLVKKLQFGDGAAHGGQMMKGEMDHSKHGGQEKMEGMESQ